MSRDRAGGVWSGARRLIERGGGAGLVFLVVLGAWQAYVTASGVPTVILPSPVEVVVAAGANWRRLAVAASVTAATAGVGLLLGTVAGLLFAFAMVVSRTVRVAGQPYLVALRIAPLVAIAPLLFLWIGTGLLSRALLVATLTVFPVTVASLDGLRSTPEVYLDLLRSVDAPRFRWFLHVRVPAAAPSVLAGVKLAAALGTIGAVVAEFLTLRAGLGYQLFTAADNLRTALMFAALGVLEALGLALYLSVARIQRVVTRRAGD